MFEIRKYSPEQQQKWDAYVSKARNATFLFYRNYMDYHADRFADYSLMIYKNGKLHSLLPAHQIGQTLYSHYGLTYGGLIMDIHVTAADTCDLFAAMNAWLRARGFKKVVYRPIPWVYHTIPAEEDLYAIFWKCHARLLVKNIGTVIFIQQHLKWRRNHLRLLRKAQTNGVSVKRNGDLSEFWPLLSANLNEKFHTKPVHSLAEIELLKSRFPDHIIQYNAYRDRHIIGGLTLYITPQMVHAQYSSSNGEGKEFGAMEAIYEQVISHDYANYLYLDFGSSTEQAGAFLNTGLIGHKEGYGGRAITYDTYEWDINAAHD